MVAHMWPKTLLPPSLAVMIWLAKWDKMNIVLCQFQVTLIINQSELNYQDIDQIFSVKNSPMLYMVTITKYYELH